MSPFCVMPEEETGWVRIEITQRNQFDSDEHGLAETFVREFLQNSVDARTDTAGGAATVRFGLHTLSGAAAAYMTDVLGPLHEHLEASGIEVPSGDAISVLTAEDFGTLGLRGRYDQYAEGENYSAFFNGHGLSNKGGKSNGRWGLGKTTYSSASRIRTFFALTVRADDAGRLPLLMGQSVLSVHKLASGKAYKPHVFIAGPDRGDYPLPLRDATRVSEFSGAVGFSRKNEPGLSIAIPYVQEDITSSTLIVEVLRNYYFPILTGRLVVFVGDVEISAKTFDTVMKQFGVEELGADFATFVRDVDAARKKPADTVLLPQWRSDLASAISREQLEAMRAIYADGKMVHVDAPVSLRRQNGRVVDTVIHLFLRKAPEGSTGRALFVRGDITVPGMASNFQVRTANAALIASEDEIVAFLGDSENPAHTHWDGRAEKLKANWKAGSERIKEIKTVLKRLHGCLDQSVNADFPNALQDIFSVKADANVPQNRERKHIIRKKKIVVVERKPKMFRIVRRSGGFAVKPGPGLTAEGLPMQIKLRMAYDVSRGNPFKKYSPFDFDLTTENGAAVSELEGAKAKTLSGNRLAIDVEDIDFSVNVTGFDSRRDLIVDAER